MCHYVHVFLLKIPAHTYRKMCRYFCKTDAHICTYTHPIRFWTAVFYCNQVIIYSRAGDGQVLSAKGDDADALAKLHSTLRTQRKTYPCILCTSYRRSLFYFVSQHLLKYYANLRKTIHNPPASQSSYPQFTQGAPVSNKRTYTLPYRTEYSDNMKISSDPIAGNLRPSSAPSMMRVVDGGAPLMAPRVEAQD